MAGSDQKVSAVLKAAQEQAARRMKRLTEEEAARRVAASGDADDPDYLSMAAEVEEKEAERKEWTRAWEAKRLYPDDCLSRAVDKEWTRYIQGEWVPLADDRRRVRRDGSVVLSAEELEAMRGIGGDSFTSAKEARELEPGSAERMRSPLNAQAVELIDSLRRQLKERRSVVEQLTRQLRERDAVIASLHRDVALATAALEQAWAGAAMARVDRPSAGAGRFVRRPHGDYDTSIARVERAQGEDSLVVHFTDAARMAWNLGELAVIDGPSLYLWRGDVDAQSWWHLCAIIGWPEWKARLFYFHPEEGQQSAAAGATSLEPKRRARPRHEVQVACQGDWLDD